jgi:hypothetical protein
MSQYSRSIETKTNIIFFDPENRELSATIDCSELAAEKIAFVCEEDGVMWVEHTPFEDRQYEFDIEKMENYFQMAKEAWIAENDLEMSAIDVTPTIMSVDGFFALDVMKFSSVFETWISSEDRTFLQKAYFNHSTIWKNNDEILLTCLSDIGMSEQQIDDLFELAASRHI